VLADRVAVGVVEDRIAEQLAERGGLVGTPGVDIGGFPFLTQAIAGRYDDVRLSLDTGQLADAPGTRADVSLRGVHVPLSAALSGSVTQVPVDRIEGSATVSYDQLAAALGGDATVAPEGDRLRITRTVELLGRTLPLTAAGTVSLDGDELVVDVERAGGAGVEIPAFLVGRASGLLDLRYPVDLPFGLRLTGVTPGPDGVQLTVEATDAVLSAQ
jgi:hypothetical protein